MRSPPKMLLAVALAALVLAPAPAMTQQAGAKQPATKAAKTSKQPVKKRWRGYGFLPGYRQPPDLTDWRLRSPRHYAQRSRYERRYLRYWPYSGYSQLQYGWGYPHVYRGRWNGGSFGPCWTSTPIGMMWNCGQ